MKVNVEQAVNAGGGEEAGSQGTAGDYHASRVSLPVHFPDLSIDIVRMSVLLRGNDIVLALYAIHVKLLSAANLIHFYYI